MHGLRSLLIGGVGGAGGVVVARYFLPPDITYQERSQAMIEPLLETKPEVPSRQEEILKYGAPTTGIPSILTYSNHVLEYDTARRVPRWVAEHLTREMTSRSEADRKKANFQPDPAVPIEFSAHNKDFWQSGWSRGHMAPAGNNKHNQEAMNQTFLLTNIVPQDLENNGNYWNRLEIYCRGLTSLYSDVYIISGPLWLPQAEDDKFQTIQDHVRIGELVPVSVSGTANTATLATIQENTPAGKSPASSGPVTAITVDVNNENVSTDPSSSIVIDNLQPGRLVSAGEPSHSSNPVALHRTEKQDRADCNVNHSDSQRDLGKAAKGRREDFRPSKVRPPRPTKKLVKYPVIGRNNVAVPTHLYKVVLVEDPSLEAPLLGAFIVPNAPVQDVQLADFEVELKELERHVGLKFHSQLDRERTGKLCSVQGCRLQDYKEFQEFFWMRRLSSSWNLRGLERDWAELQKRIKLSPALEQLYLAKRKELTERQQQDVRQQRTAEETGDTVTRAPGGTTAESSAAAGG